MAEWIDKLVGQLKDEEKHKNLEYAMKLRNDGLIDARAPAFWAELLEAIKQLADELDQKIGATLGGVKASIQDERFHVWNLRPVAKASVKGKFDPHAKQIDIDTSVEGTSSNLLISHIPSHRKFRFQIDADDLLFVASDKGGDRYHDPSELADAILSAAFTKSLFVPY